MLVNYQPAMVSVSLPNDDIHTYPHRPNLIAARATLPHQAMPGMTILPATGAPHVTPHVIPHVCPHVAPHVCPHGPPHKPQSLMVSLAMHQHAMRLRRLSCKQPRHAAMRCRPNCIYLGA